MQNISEALSASKAMDDAAEPFIASAITHADALMMHMIVVGRTIARKFPTDEKKRETITGAFHLYLDVIIEDELHKLGKVPQ